MLAVIPFLLVLSFPGPSEQASPQTQKIFEQQKVFEQVAKDADEARTANRLNDAVDLYTRGVRLKPTWSEGWWWLGSILYEQDRFAEAQNAFSRFVKLGGKPGPAYAFLALCEYENRQYERALEHFQIWSKSGSPGNEALLDVAAYHWALLLIRKGQFAQALYLLAAKAKKVGPSPALSEAMGLASLRMTWLPTEYPFDKREFVWLAGNAAIAAARDDNLRANEFAHRLEARYPRERNVHYFLGTLLGFQKKFPEAAAEYKQELELSPEHVPALTELAMAEVRSFDPGSALPFAERAVKLDPANPRALYALGKALVDTGHYHESIPHLELARRYAPSSSLIRSALATAYRQEGRLEEAKREAAAFLALQDKEELLAPLEESSPSPQKTGTRP